MSHISSVDVCISNLVSFKRACKNLGLTFNKDVTTYKSQWTSEIECAGTFTDEYGGEAALVKNKDGSYSIELDKYMNSITSKIGENAEILNREYTTEEVKSRASQVGIVSDVNINDDGQVVVVGSFL